MIGFITAITYTLTFKPLLKTTMKLATCTFYLYCLLIGACDLVWANQSILIDSSLEKPTSTTNFTAGQTVAENPFLYRKIIEISDNHHYRVQNFYKQTHDKQSDIFTITEPNNLAIFQQLQIYNLNNLIFDGPLTLWSTNGKKSMYINAKNGNAEGPFNTYYVMSGNKEIEGYYYAGKPDGVWKYWTEAGKLDKQIYFQHGIIQWQKESIQIQGF